MNLALTPLPAASSAMNPAFAQALMRALRSAFIQRIQAQQQRPIIDPAEAARRAIAVEGRGGATSADVPFAYDPIVLAITGLGAGLEGGVTKGIQTLLSQPAMQAATGGTTALVNRAFPNHPWVGEIAGAALPLLAASPETPGVSAAIEDDLSEAPIAAERLTGPVDSEPGYAYHATNEENLHDIAQSGKLDTHKPWEHTDQEAWPDGTTEKRNYFTADAQHTWQFAPEEGKPVLLRVSRDAHPLKAESTNDLYSTKPVNSSALEYLGVDGKWHAVDGVSYPRKVMR